MQTCLQDLRYGARMLRKQPGFTLVVLFVSALVAEGCQVISSRSQSSSEPFRKASMQKKLSGQEWIEREFTLSGAPSLTMVVAQDGRFLWERSWGWADKEKRIAATPQTMYSLASISKVITATGLMLLAERRQIDLDKPIDDYLGDAKLRAYVGDARQATVRKVAHHTAGLPIHYNTFYADETRRLPPFAETMRRYGILVRPPGERFEYANFGYELLAQAIAQTSKQGFAAFIQREVCEPLALLRLTYGTPSGTEIEIATRYGRTGSPLPFFENDTGGASGFYASAHDLARFAFLFLGTLEAGQRQILSEAAFATMTQKPTDSQFGIGWMIDYQSDTRIVFCGGLMDGVGTVILMVPEKRFVVVGLCNAGINLPVGAAEEVLRQTFPDKRWELSFGMPPPSAEPVPQTVIGNWAGELSAHNGQRRFRLWVHAQGEIEAQLSDQARVRVSDTQWAGGQLSGSFTGDLGTDDLSTPQRLTFALTLRGDLLGGPITARTARTERIGNGLSSYLSLKKEGGHNKVK